MGRERRAPRGKKIRPHFWVFCEGETEEAYVKFLRSEYRIPIDIVPKVAGSSISNKFINNYKKGKPVHEKDMDFLMYDGDVKEILDKLLTIESVTVIVSTPSIELWFLLHYKNQKAEISTNECIKELCNRNKERYKKGLIDKKLFQKLQTKQEEASIRAKKLKLYNNPSTNMYEFIEKIEAADVN